MELAIEILRVVLPRAVLVAACGIEAWSGRGYGLVLLGLVALGIDLWATSNIQRIDALHGGLGYDLTEALWFFVETLYTGLVGSIGFVFAALAHQRSWGFTQLGALALVGLTLLLPLVLPSSLVLTLVVGGAPIQMAARGPYLLILSVPLALTECLPEAHGRTWTAKDYATRDAAMAALGITPAPRSARRSRSASPTL